MNDMIETVETLLSPDERADILNAINEVMYKNGYRVEAAGYEDDGNFFTVIMTERIGDISK